VPTVRPRRTTLFTLMIPPSFFEVHSRRNGFDLARIAPTLTVKSSTGQELKHHI
jgi:hypothetical protein